MIEPNEGHFHSFLGDIEQKNNRLKTAQRHYDKAIRLNDNFFYYHLQRGLISKKLNDDINAKRFLERSLQLLPTDNAYNALGNISRSMGDFKQAIGYYTKAADQNSIVGQKALASLIELDLPSNPSKYIKVRYGLAQDSTLKLQIMNTTPRGVDGIAILLQYPDEHGRLKQINRQVPGRLPAGKSQVFKTKIKIDPKFVPRVRVTVTHARLRS